ncbi:hypothetical protein BGZ58_004657, partial [Dissophora ornata]
MRIKETVVETLDENDLEIVRSMMELHLDKRELPPLLCQVFDSYADVTVPYALFYNIVSGDIGHEADYLNPMILRVLCCKGNHEEERRVILSADEISESIKLM